MVFVTINKFAKMVALAEGKKKQVDIAQIKEILRIVDEMVNGMLYTLIYNL